MKRSSIVFLQGVILLIGIGVLAFMLTEPQFEGRNAHSTVFQIYFNDPFLAYAFLGSIPFFVSLYQAFKLLGQVAKNEVFSRRSVQALRIIKYCAVSLIVFIGGGEAYFVFVQRTKEDIAGGVMMGLFLIFIALVIGTAAAVFEKALQSAVDLKSENDLTV